MATGNTRHILRVPGRLVVNPSNLALAFPYGGVEVGLVRSVTLQQLASPLVIQCAGIGGPSDVLEGQEQWAFAAFARGWDDDAIRYLLASMQQAGSPSSHRSMASPGTALPGTSALSRAVSLLYVPDNPLDAPAMLIYRTVLVWAESQEMAFQRREELGIPLQGVLLRDGSSRIFEIGRLSDLTL